MMGLLNEQSGRPIHTMASWHLFTEGRIRGWLLRRIGGFSILRGNATSAARPSVCNDPPAARTPVARSPSLYVGDR